MTDRRMWQLAGFGAHVGHCRKREKAPPIRARQCAKQMPGTMYPDPTCNMLLPCNEETSAEAQLLKRCRLPSGRAVVLGRSAGQSRLLLLSSIRTLGSATGAQALLQAVLNYDEHAREQGESAEAHGPMDVEMQIAVLMTWGPPCVLLDNLPNRASSAIVEKLSLPLQTRLQP